MKQYRCLPNKSDGIFSVSFPYHFRIISVSFPYRFRIVSVSFPYRFRINPVLFPYRSPIILLLRSGKQYGMERKTNE